ncbi:condensation domain-containing protein [Aspergillus coremiiformis]|uniref:Condensation domain-containing protein n=1 Tax=Aspergillus coremiiformis TaxID=138285 RepID=A0A5N6Z1X3_9EURO|nr:condensation domain-containing protein [Aspergillus coremiiformis]
MLRSVLSPSPHDPMKPIQVVLKMVHGAVQIVNTPRIKTAAQLRDFRPVQCRDGRMLHHSTLAEGPDGQVWWLFEFDKALIDAASMTILLQEVAAISDSRSCLLDAAPCYSQYASFVHNLPQDAELAFWEQTLRGTPPCLLPKSPHPGLPSRSATPRVHTVIKQITSSGMLTALCRASGLTATNVFQTIWGLVLARSTGSMDVCFGTLKSCHDAAVPGILEMKVIKTTRDISGRLFNTCLTVQPAMITATDSQNVHFELLETHDLTEYNVVAAVILFPSYYELHIRYWDDFCSEPEALQLLHEFCDTATEVARVLEAMSKQENESH